MHLISHHALNANSTGTSMPHAQHIALSAVSDDDFPACICEAFSFLFFYGRAQFYIFSVFACERHTVGIFFFFACFLISSLAPLIMHSRYSDPLLMRWRWGWRKKWKEKWSGFDWRRRKRGNHQLWNRNVSETYTTGVVVFFVCFLHLFFYNKQQKLHYFKNTWSMTWGIFFVFYWWTEITDRGQS